MKDIEPKTIYKSANDLNVEYQMNTTKQHRLLFRAFISEAQKHVKDAKDNYYIFTISLQTIRDILDQQWLHPFDIMRYSTVMIKAGTIYQIDSILPDGSTSTEYVSGGAVIGVRYAPSSPSLQYAFNPFLMEKILRPEQYTNINISTITKTINERTDLVYHFLCRYLNAPKVPIMTIREFRRKILLIEDEKYPVFGEFHRRVLVPIWKDINKSDIRCKYHLIKGPRRAWESIQWEVKAEEGKNPNKSAKNPKKTLVDDKSKDVLIVEMPVASVEPPITSAEPSKTYDEWYQYFRAEGWSDEYAKMKANDAFTDRDLDEEELER